MDQTTVAPVGSGLPFSPSYLLGGVVLGLSLCHLVAPWAVDEGLGLVPHHTVFTPVPSIPIPFLWNVGTAHFFEANPLKAVVHIPVIVVLTKLLEKLWSVKAIALHVAFTTFCTGSAFFLAELIHVYRTHHEKDFFIPVSGCGGLLVALAVGVRHAYPLEPLPLLPKGLGLQYQHLPFVIAAVTTVLGCLMPKVFPEWSFAPFALFFGWLHLRYLMWFPHAQAYGDHSEEFDFGALFPRLLRPFVSCLGAVTHGLSAMVAPGFVQLRVVDPEAGQGKGIVYDPTAANFSNQNVSWNPGQGAAPEGPGSKEYNARRAKALAMLDQNISSLLTPENSTRKMPNLAKEEGVELGSVRKFADPDGGAPSLAALSSLGRPGAASPHPRSGAGAGSPILGTRSPQKNSPQGQKDANE